MISLAVLSVFNEVQPTVKAAVYLFPISCEEQSLNRLGNIGNFWLAPTRFSPTFQYGISGVLGGTTQEFLTAFKRDMGQDATLLNPVSL